MECICQSLSLIINFCHSEQGNISAPDPLWFDLPRHLGDRQSNPSFRSHSEHFAGSAAVTQYCTARGTLLNVIWQPGWEGSFGENGYMYMYGWVPLLDIWNFHNIVNWLYPNTKCAVCSCSVVSNSLQSHGLFIRLLQARVLEWVVMPSSRASSQPRDQTQVSHIAGRVFTVFTVWGSPQYKIKKLKNISLSL